MDGYSFTVYNMKKFKEFFNEKTFLQNPEETLNRIDALLKGIKPLVGKPLLWRGFKGARPISGIEVIDNSRGLSFYGGMSDLSKNILKELNVDNVVFATHTPSQAQFFGTPYIFVPLTPMTPYHSVVVDDIWAIASKKVGDMKRAIGIDKEDTFDVEMYYSAESKMDDSLKKEIAKYYADTYKKEIMTHNEIIIDVKQYALVDPIKILDIVPAWIEKKMGYNKYITLSPEDSELAKKYMYEPLKRNELKGEEAERVRVAINNYNAYISAKSGSTSSNQFDLKFGKNLKSYEDIQKFMTMFKSYVEFMLKK